MGFCFFGLKGEAVLLLFVYLFTSIHNTCIILKLVSSPYGYSLDMALMSGPLVNIGLTDDA